MANLFWLYVVVSFNLIVLLWIAYSIYRMKKHNENNSD